MAAIKLPEENAVLLVRALGLLVGQAAIYGPLHNVTQHAAQSVFAELEQSLRAFGPIEMAVRDRQMLVNGFPDGIDLNAGKNLADRMVLHKVTGILFLAGLDFREFLIWIRLFGTPPMDLALDGGLEGAVKKAGLKNVRMVAIAYQRMEDAPPPPKPSSPPPVATAPAVRAPSRPAMPAVGVLDLSAALGGEDGAAPESSAALEEKSADEASSSVRQRSAADLAALLRQTAALLERGGDAESTGFSPEVTGALSRIRTILAELSERSKHGISALADQVDEDRQTIASIESAARRRGIGLKLTRAELIQRYAELNQEIVQPLTVSTGVIEMLNAQMIGGLSEKQRELLRMAGESIRRVDQLVSYMNRISGLPETYTPDSQIIRDSYR